MEAGTGIEPVFTDLQSHNIPRLVNNLGPKKSQDNSGTGHEPETCQKENPGALAGASGADQHGKSLKTKAYQNGPRNAMSLYAKDRHKRVCRMLGYALTLDEPDIWQAMGMVFLKRLTGLEIASIAYLALDLMTPQDRELVLEAVEVGES